MIQHSVWEGVTLRSGSAGDRPGPSPFCGLHSCRSRRGSRHRGVVARRRRRRGRCSERVDAGRLHLSVQLPAAFVVARPRRRRSTPGDGSRTPRRRRRRPGLRVRRSAGRRVDVVVRCRSFSRYRPDRPVHGQLHSVRPPAERDRYELLD